MPSSSALLWSLFLAVAPLLGCSAPAEEARAPETTKPASDGGVSTTDAATDAGSDTRVQKSDGGFCPPPLGTASPRPASRPAKGPLDDTLRLNHLQAKATHNSYHLAKPGGPSEYAYSHAPLDVQLEAQGVRGLELDLHYDQECERHEVYHQPLSDDASTCGQLTECLQLVRSWSDAHLGHHPLFVQIEPKDDSDLLADERLGVLEREILSVFPREAIVTPDEVKGSAATLAEAVATGWPTLAATRGRVVFYMLASGGLRDVYTHGGKDLSGRLLFVSSGVGEPYASIAVIDDPITRREDIDKAVAAGLLVRTFAECSVLEAAPAFARAALASGAQILATDYPVKVASTSWVLENPGTPSRCNVVTAPSTCTNDAIEGPARLATP